MNQLVLILTTDCRYDSSLCSHLLFLNTLHVGKRYRIGSAPRALQLSCIQLFVSAETSNPMTVYNLLPFMFTGPCWNKQVLGGDWERCEISQGKWWFHPHLSTMEPPNNGHIESGVLSFAGRVTLVSHTLYPEVPRGVACHVLSEDVAKCTKQKIHGLQSAAG